MVRLVNKPEEKRVESEQEKKERLQREQDFAGEFGEVRKSGISATADKLISSSKPANPLKFVKLFNEIDDDEQAIDLSDYEREKESDNPRKKQKKNDSSVEEKRDDTQESASRKDEIEPENEVKEKIVVEKSEFPKLVKIEDDSLPEDNDTLQNVVSFEQVLPQEVRPETSEGETIAVETENNVPPNNLADKEVDTDEGGDEEFFDATDKPEEAPGAKESSKAVRFFEEASQNNNEKTTSEGNITQEPLTQENSQEPLKSSSQENAFNSPAQQQQEQTESTQESEIEPEATDNSAPEGSTEASTKISDFELLKLKTKIYSKFTSRSDIIPYGLEPKYREIYRLLEATVQDHESQSALIIGPKNSGKTSCLNIALKELRSQVKNRRDEFLFIKISGLIQDNDKAAVKSIARQLDTEISRVYKVNVKELHPSELLKKKSVTETFSNILNILDKQVLLEDESSGSIHIPIVFVIDEVEVFANPNRQTLLYNLFDLVENSSTPITTICLSSKFTVKDSLEKRVRSRFSQRMIQFTKFNEEQFIEISKKILSIDEPENDYENQWNKHIEELINNQSSLRKLIIYNHLTVNNFKELHNHCTFPISKISKNQPFLNDVDFEKYSANNNRSSWKNIINTLSEIELSLLVSAARLITKNDLNWINLNSAYEEYKSMAKMQNKERSVNVFNTSVINTGFKIWTKETCETPWGVLQKLGLLTPPTNAGKSGKTIEFSNNTVETKMWQLEVTLDELRLILLDSEKNVKGWTRL